MTTRIPIIKSLEKAFDILECFLNDNMELSFTEIINMTGFPPGTAHRLIATLEINQYLSRKPVSKKYYLGPKIAHLGRLAITNLKDSSSDIILPFMFELKTLINESVSLFVVIDKYRVCIERVDSDRILKTNLQVGERLHINQGASGKMLLSHMPKEKIEALAGDYDEKLLSELSSIKEKGYSISIGEREKGLAAIAAPIYDASGELYAALSVAGPIDRILKDNKDKNIATVVDYCSKISRALGYNIKKPRSSS